MRALVIGVDNSYPPDPSVWIAGQYVSETSAERDRGRFMEQRSLEAQHISYHTVTTLAMQAATTTKENR